MWKLYADEHHFDLFALGNDLRARIATRRYAAEWIVLPRDRAHLFSGILA